MKCAFLVVKQEEQHKRVWSQRKPTIDTMTNTEVVLMLEFKLQYHFIANTNSVHKRHINKKVMEFVNGKPKGTNPAIMGNPIDMYAANGSKKQSILLLEKPHLN